MKTTHRVTAGAAAAVLAFGMGTAASFAAAPVPHNYADDAQVIVNGYCKAVTDVNKWDRPSVDKATRAQAIQDIEAIREQLRAHDPATGAATGAGAIPSTDGYADISGTTAEEFEALIAEANAAIAEIDKTYEIYAAAHGEDMAKYYLKDKLTEKAELEKQIEAANKGIETAKNYEADYEAWVADYENQFSRINTLLRDLRYNVPVVNDGTLDIPGFCLGSDSVVEPADPEVKPADPEVKPADPEVKPAEDLKVDEEKKAAEDKKAESKKDVVKAAPLSKTGSTVGLLGLFGVALAGAGVAVRKFI